MTPTNNDRRILASCPMSMSMTSQDKDRMQQILINYESSKDSSSSSSSSLIRTGVLNDAACKYWRNLMEEAEEETTASASASATIITSHHQQQKQQHQRNLAHETINKKRSESSIDHGCIETMEWCRASKKSRGESSTLQSPPAPHMVGRRQTAASSCRNEAMAVDYTTATTQTQQHSIPSVDVNNHQSQSPTTTGFMWPPL